MNKIRQIILFLFSIKNLNAQIESELPFYKWARIASMGWNNWNCFGPAITVEKV
ncbi:MAG: hypothetical protein JXR46_03565 [Calditrichaceae bacterium]|nr:hypothetical protein [Calditrichaceae bacterium]